MPAARSLIECLVRGANRLEYSPGFYPKKKEGEQSKEDAVGGGDCESSMSIHCRAIVEETPPLRKPSPPPADWSAERSQ